jgi:putative FmdB family regulatory protein
MPIYEYACGKCEHEFEVEQRITDAPLKTCPKCKSRRVKKLISLTSFVLKGDGWFSDLYSSSKDDKDKDKDKGEKSDGADTPKKDDDAKPEKKVDKTDKKVDKKSEKSGKKSEGKKGSSKAA